MSGRGPFAAVELPLAWFNFVMAVTVVVWKLAGGMAWFTPFGLGAAFDRVFTDGYYPRKPRQELEYNFLFLLLYGVVGTMAQWSGLQLARRRDRVGAAPPARGESLLVSTANADKWRANNAHFLFGCFHVLMGCYHSAVVWSHGAIGKTALFDDAPPTVMWVFRALYAAELYTALDYLLWSRQHRRKVALDALSFCNNAPMLVLWAMAWVGFNNPAVNEVVRVAGFLLCSLATLVAEWAL